MTNFTILPCGWKECVNTRPANGSALCDMHRSRQRKGQDMDAPKRGRPRGTGTVNKNGYIIHYRPDHPNSNKHGYVAEHTIVMAEAIGRSLFSHENVHHKNGVRSDNRVENLELWMTHQPKGQRVSDILDWAENLLKQYGRI